MIREVVGMFLCRSLDWHDVFPKRTGLCRRCGFYVDESGSVHR